MSEGTFGRRDLFKRAAAIGAGLGLTGTAAQAHTPDAFKVAQQASTVPRKSLGSTGKDIPIIVMGGSQTFDMSYDKVLHNALKLGVNYIDCAQAYAAGQSHKGVGNFIEQVGRDKLWITSKVMLGGRRATPEGFVSNMESFLPDLRTDYLDMFFMHSVNSLDLLEPEFIKMSHDLKRQGRIHHFGFSCHQSRVVDLMNKAAQLGSEAIDCIMFRYNFTMYGDYELNKAIDACKKAGIGLIAMKTQASVPEDSEKVRTFRSENFTLAQAKLKAVWADERIDAAVSEMTNTQQLRENTAAAMSGTQLSMGEFHELNQYAAQTAHHRCLGCDHICESRVQGDLKISDTLRYLMYAECYGKPERARELYRELAPSERNFDGVDLAGATRACPQGIDIAKRLEDARRMLG